MFKPAASEKSLRRFNNKQKYDKEIISNSQNDLDSDEEEKEPINNQKRKLK